MYLSPHRVVLIFLPSLVFSREATWTQKITMDAISQDHADIHKLVANGKLQLDPFVGVIFPLTLVQSCMRWDDVDVQNQKIAWGNNSMCESKCSDANIIICSRGNTVCFFESILCKAIPVMTEHDIAHIQSTIMYDVRRLHYGIEGNDLRSIDMNLIHRNLDIFFKSHTVLTTETEKHRLDKQLFNQIYRNNTVKLLACVPPDSDPQKALSYIGGNAGDMLSLSVVDHFLSPKGINLSTKGMKTSPPYLAAIGSVLHMVLCAKSGVRIVWGSGLRHRSKCMHGLNDIIWQGVRGPMTRNYLVQHLRINPPVIKDPGLLSPTIFNLKVEQVHELGIILHKYDFQDKLLVQFLNLSALPWLNMGSNSLDHNLRVLLTFKRIMSSSLHGIILAHAFGIPCVPIKIPGTRSTDVKFKDHFYSVGMYSYKERTYLKNNVTPDEMIHIVQNYGQPVQPIDTSLMLDNFPFPEDK